MNIQDPKITELKTNIASLYDDRSKLVKEVMNIDSRIIGMKEQLLQIIEFQHQNNLITYDLEDE